MSTTLEFPTVMALEPITALWPSIVIAFMIMVYRKFIDKRLRSTAKSFTEYQIEQNKPKWLSELLNQNTVQNGHELMQDLKQFDSICEKSDLSTSQHRELKTYHKACNDIETKIDKLLESIFKVTMVTLIAIYGFYVVNIKHDLFVNHRGQWPAYPDIEPYRQKSDPYLLWYYIVSLGYHLQRTFLQFHNPARKDFVALIIHHWSTIICVLFSYLAAFLRTGSLVLFIHESSDIFLETAKICGYIGWTLGSEIFFLLFVLSWFYMRIYAFSYKILYEIIRFGSKQLWIANSPLFFNWTCVILLFVLEGLHLYWSTMIISMIIRKVRSRGSTLKDIRSGTESGKDD